MLIYFRYKQFWEGYFRNKFFALFSVLGTIQGCVKTQGWITSIEVRGGVSSEHSIVTFLPSLRSGRG